MTKAVSLCTLYCPDLILHLWEQMKSDYY